MALTAQTDGGGFFFQKILKSDIIVVSLRRKTITTMKRILTTLLVLVALTVTAQADEVPLLGNVYARQTTLLNGDWNYIVDVQEEGYYDYRMNVSRWGFFQNAKPQRPEDLIEYDFDKAPKMQIPSDCSSTRERCGSTESSMLKVQS